MIEKNYFAPQVGCFTDGVFYRKIMEQARDIMLVIRQDGIIIDANQAALDAYDYSIEEIRKLHVHDLRPSETHAEISVQMKMAQLCGILFRTVHIRRNGQCFPVEVSARRVRFENGEALVSIIRDITKTVAMEAALKESEEKFRLLVENLYTGVYLIKKNRFVYVNPSTQKITGYDEAELLHMNFWEIVHPVQRDEVRVRGIRRQEGYEEPAAYIMHIRRKDGENRWCEMVVVRRELAGSVTLIGLLHDVTDRVKAEEMLAIKEKQYRLLAENAWDVIWTIDKEWRFTYVSPSIMRLQGYAPEEILYRNMFDIVVPDFRPAVAKHFRQLLSNGEIGNQERICEFQILHKSGIPIWVEVSTNLLHDDDTVNGLLCVSRDVTERKRMQDELLRLATTDELTGVVNRAQFMKLGNQEMERSLRYGRMFSLLFVDLDYFKRINDTYGHKVGDQTLIWFANSMRAMLRDFDVLGRLGGDEFAILLPETNARDAFQIGERLRKALTADSLPVGDNENIAITVSIGVAAREENDLLFDELLKKADAALYKAKRLGRNCVQIEN